MMNLLPMGNPAWTGYNQFLSTAPNGPVCQLPALQTHNMAVQPQVQEPQPSIQIVINASVQKFTKYQQELLHGLFELVKYPNRMQRQVISKRLGITLRQARMWFDNRRRKDLSAKSQTTENTEEEVKKRAMKVVPAYVMQSVIDDVLEFADDPKGIKYRARQKKPQKIAMKPWSNSNLASSIQAASGSQLALALGSALNSMGCGQSSGYHHGDSGQISTHFNVPQPHAYNPVVPHSYPSSYPSQNQLLYAYASADGQMATTQPEPMSQSMPEVSATSYVATLPLGTQLPAVSADGQMATALPEPMSQSCCIQDTTYSNHLSQISATSQLVPLPLATQLTISSADGEVTNVSPVSQPLGTTFTSLTYSSDVPNTLSCDQVLCEPPTSQNENIPLPSQLASATPLCQISYEALSLLPPDCDSMNTYPDHERSMYLDQELLCLSPTSPMSPQDLSVGIQLPQFLPSDERSVTQPSQLSPSDKPKEIPTSQLSPSDQSSSIQLSQISDKLSGIQVSKSSPIDESSVSLPLHLSPMDESSGMQVSQLSPSDESSNDQVFTVISIPSPAHSSSAVFADNQLCDLLSTTEHIKLSSAGPLAEVSTSTQSSTIAPDSEVSTMLQTTVASGDATTKELAQVGNQIPLSTNEYSNSFEYSCTPGDIMQNSDRSRETVESAFTSCADAFSLCDDVFGCLDNGGFDPPDLCNIDLSHSAELSFSFNAMSYPSLGGVSDREIQRSTTRTYEDATCLFLTDLDNNHSSNATDQQPTKRSSENYLSQDYLSCDSSDMLTTGQSEFSSDLDTTTLDLNAMLPYCQSLLI